MNISHVHPFAVVPCAAETNIPTTDIVPCIFQIILYGSLALPDQKIWTSFTILGLELLYEMEKCWAKLQTQMEAPFRRQVLGSSFLEHKKKLSKGAANWAYYNMGARIE
jgi:hypothetical protein